MGLSPASTHPIAFDDEFGSWRINLETMFWIRFSSETVDFEITIVSVAFRMEGIEQHSHNLLAVRALFSPVHVLPMIVWANALIIPCSLALIKFLPLICISCIWPLGKLLTQVLYQNSSKGLWHCLRLVPVFCRPPAAYAYLCRTCLLLLIVSSFLLQCKRWEPDHQLKIMAK